MNIDDGVVNSNPWLWFQASFDRASKTEPFDAARAALATADLLGRPSVRFVLVKRADERGFVFFTNLRSAKARDLAANANAALAFHWETIGEQVRAEGNVGQVDETTADEYFSTRPRNAQVAAWASQQSLPIANRKMLEDRFAEVQQRFAGAPRIPRPPEWGGYCLVPTRIEFWKDRDDRLHDRWSFERTASAWNMIRLQP
jgi:pyridoxamine 5'-phosphate oxidase